MKGLLKKLRPGQSTSLLLLIGLLIVLVLSRVKRLSSKTAMELDQLIQTTLRGAGYSETMARIVAAVSRHETGNYTSHVFKTLNNMFGMRYPRVRETTALYESRDSKYSVYSSPADSVRDMVLYLNARRYPFHVSDARALVTLMKKHGYFEDNLENYVNGVERALTKVTPI
jgi:hypothetical protein